MVLRDTSTLSNGVEIPKVGLGTWLVDDHAAAEAVRAAAAIGYRHVDTAQAYGNEHGVGEGIRTCGVPRDEMFVTTKVAAEVKSHDAAAEAIQESLATLGIGPIDLMIIHSPQPWAVFGGTDRFPAGNRAVWRALEEAYRTGVVRSIGVSNFQPADVDNIMARCTVAPMVNQVLAHIGDMPMAVIGDARRRGILVEAYSPLAHGELMENRRVAAMARRYGVSVAQLSIRYTLQLGLLPLPKTTNPAHMRENARLDFEITDADMGELTGMNRIRDDGDAGAIPDGFGD